MVWFIVLKNLNDAASFHAKFALYFCAQHVGKNIRPNFDNAENMLS
jgi:hypothetical protein